MEEVTRHKRILLPDTKIQTNTANKHISKYRKRIKIKQFKYSVLLSFVFTCKYVVNASKSSALSSREFEKLLNICFENPEAKKTP